ncbi:hypothetical protein [Anaerosacchariphilus polymeriproducens]|uniref:hypothetical protein n=1 Tax=Anaerosacchariphilus polymeriproducens TaxID=1812858 RepID=UPI0012D78FD5|nr:hypothetical protein [Anaerosacchariphilus polymeriproducens]
MEKVSEILNELSRENSMRRNEEMNIINSFYEGYEKGITDLSKRIEYALQEEG